MKWIGFFMVVAGFIIAALAVVIDQSAIKVAGLTALSSTAVTELASSIAFASITVSEPVSSMVFTLTAANELASSMKLASTIVTELGREDTVKWVWYVPALAAGVLGVAIIRATRARQSKTEHHVAANIETVETTLARIATNIQKLNVEKDSINTYNMRHRIDELLVDDLSSFVDARESIAHRYGLAAYGEVMSSFAAGERYLNRVWSASADGYIDEVNAYLDKALAQFVETDHKVRQLKEDTPPTV